MQLRQITPEARVVDTLELLAGVDLDERASGERPYTIVNFIASVDGRASFQGRSAALGDPVDRELFHGLREQVAAVMAGTATMRIERYGRAIRDPEARRRRVERGRSAEPLMCVVTRSGIVPTEAPVFSEPGARIVVFGPPGLELGESAAQVEVVGLDPGELTLTTALRTLYSQFGVRSLLCEGGPTLFAGLLQERLVDELFLTLAPKLAGGGTSPTLTTGPELPELLPLELVWVLEHAGSLYLRYRVA